ncbi:MAG TPA: hypothetical protein PKI99_03730 [Terrimesophilobacter sp.]|nr:hypothetical protein [Terrimesophilobacter sp.]
MDHGDSAAEQRCTIYQAQVDMRVTEAGEDGAGEVGGCRRVGFRGEAESACIRDDRRRSAPAANPALVDGEAEPAR